MLYIDLYSPLGQKTQTYHIQPHTDDKNDDKKMIDDNDLSSVRLLNYSAMPTTHSLNKLWRTLSMFYTVGHKKRDSVIFFDNSNKYW